MNPGVDFCQHAHQFPTHLIVEQTRPPFIFERPMNTFGMESSTFTEVSPNRECFFLSLANVKQIVDSYLLDLIRRELYHENGEEIHELGYGPRRECCEPRHRRRFEGKGNILHFTTLEAELMTIFVPGFSYSLGSPHFPPPPRTA